MIIVRMSGGLGNQMFQYALYRKLVRLGRDVSIDDFTEYEQERTKDRVGNSRPLGLGAFGITYRRAEREALTELTDARMDPASRVRRKLLGRRSKERADEDFVFDPSFLERTEGVFTGCFQSPRYFAGIEEELRESFSFPEDTLEGDPAGLALRERIRSAPESVCVHLRYGDYLDKADLYGGICTDDYYAAGLAYLLKRRRAPRVFVFSDDAERAARWTGRMEERLPALKGRFVLAAGRGEDRGFQDLYLMSLCRDFVIANSSFSFWGSFLGRASDKQVIAPSYWNNRRDHTELGRDGIYTAEMVRVSPRGECLSDPRPLVSVIISACNVAPSIRRCIDSVRGQTYENLEIIVVDDGSADDTARIAEKAAGEDGRVRVLCRPNGGPSAARNTGLAGAKGLLIAYCDGDDAMHPGMIEAMYEALVLSGADLSVCAYRETDGREDPPRGVSPEEARRGALLLPRAAAMETLVAGGIGVPESGITMAHAVWSQLIRRETLGEIRFEEGRLSEDILYTTRVMGSASRMVYLPTPLYDYTVSRGESIMHSKIGERRIGHEIPAWEGQIAWLSENGFPDLLDLAWGVLARRLLYYWEESEEPWAGRYREWFLAHRDRIREALGREHRIRRGDRARVRLFLSSPGAYRGFAAGYALVVRLKRLLRSKET